jgi:outer membrane immunogenic protein
MKWIIAMLSLGLSLAAAPAFADEEKGLYLGAGVGQFSLGIDNFQDITGDDFDEEDTSFKVFGGWRFGGFLAAELAYIDFGGPEDTVNILGTPVDAQVEISGFAPYLVGTLELGIFELFAKVGYYFYDIDAEAGGVEADSVSDEDLVYGAGLGVVLFDHLDARLEYEIIDISDVDDADAVWLTGAWRF